MNNENHKIKTDSDPLGVGVLSSIKKNSQNPKDSGSIFQGYHEDSTTQKHPKVESPSDSFEALKDICQNCKKPDELKILECCHYLCIICINNFLEILVEEGKPKLMTCSVCEYPIYPNTFKQDVFQDTYTEYLQMVHKIKNFKEIPNANRNRCIKCGEEHNNSKTCLEFYQSKYGEEHNNSKTSLEFYQSKYIESFDGCGLCGKDFSKKCEKSTSKFKNINDHIKNSSIRPERKNSQNHEIPNSFEVEKQCANCKNYKNSIKLNCSHSICLDCLYLQLE